MRKVIICTNVVNENVHKFAICFRLRIILPVMWNKWTHNPKFKILQNCSCVHMPSTEYNLTCDNNTRFITSRNKICNVIYATIVQDFLYPNQNLQHSFTELQAITQKIFTQICLQKIDLKDCIINFSKVLSKFHFA